MAKQGMKRPENAHSKPHGGTTVPEIQGRAKSSKVRVRPRIAGTEAAEQKVWHTEPFSAKKDERPISEVYKAIDNDLARDNLENDIPAADIEDL